MNKTALVTGAAGAIGHHVVRTLVRRGWRVIGIGHGNPASDLQLADWVSGEIEATNLDRLTRQERPFAVLHLAGGSSVGPSISSPEEDFRRTVETTKRLIEWIRVATPDTALVQSSTAAVYGHAELVPIRESEPKRPVSPYGQHKLLTEQIVAGAAREFNLNVVNLRLFSVYGPGLRKQLVWELCTRLARGTRELRLAGTGLESRDWLHIEDAAAMLVDAISLAAPYAPVFNGCTGIGTSVSDVGRAVLTGFGVEAKLTFSGERRAGDPLHLVGDPAAARAAGLSAQIPVLSGLVATAREAKRILKL